MEFPIHFPQRRDKCLDYSEWKQGDSRFAWRFFNELLEHVAASHGTEWLDPRQFSAFLTGRRVAAKFWDDWAREIILGNVRYRDVKPMVVSNSLDIKGLAVSELAIFKSLGWDKGQGRVALFHLAANLENAQEKEWRKKAVKALKD